MYSSRFGATVLLSQASVRVYVLLSAWCVTNKAQAHAHGGNHRSRYRELGSIFNSDFTTKVLTDDWNKREMRSIIQSFEKEVEKGTPNCPKCHQRWSRLWDCAGHLGLRHLSGLQNSLFECHLCSDDTVSESAHTMGWCVKVHQTQSTEDVLWHLFGEHQSITLRGVHFDEANWVVLSSRKSPISHNQIKFTKTMHTVNRIIKFP